MKKFLLLLLILSGHAWAAGGSDGSSGGSCGGGGTSVQIGDQRMLLDFLRLSIPAYQDFKDPQVITFSSRDGQRETYQKSTIQTSEELTRSAPLRLALQVLRAWRDESLLGDILPPEDLFFNITWEFSRSSLVGETADLKDFSALRNLNPRLAAYYDRNFVAEDHAKSKYKISISESEWSQLAILSQAGTLLHEAFRHRQFLNDRNKTFILYDDEDLQDMTAITLLCKPRPVLTQYMSEIMAGHKKQTETKPEYGSFSEVVAKYCLPTLELKTGILSEKEIWSSK